LASKSIHAPWGHSKNVDETWSHISGSNGPPAAAHDRSPHLLLHGPKRAYGPLAYNFACQPMTKRPVRRPLVLRPRCSNFSRPRSNACKRVDQLERESAGHTRRCAEIQADLDRLKKSNASASFPFSSGSRPTPQIPAWSRPVSDRHAQRSPASPGAAYSLPASGLEYGRCERYGPSSCEE